MDLRQLAVILDVGSRAALDLEDPALSNTLAHMTEIATIYALHPNGGTLYPLNEAFAALAARVE